MFMRSRKQREPKATELQSPIAESLAEGVPEHLEMPLRQWIFSILGNDEENAQKVALDLRLRVETGDVYSPARFLASGTSREQLIDVIDSMLRLSAPSNARSFSPGATRRSYLGTYASDWRGTNIEALQEMLTLGGSAYRVNEACTGLERRVDETIHQAAAGALAASRTPKAGSAAEHMATAWQRAYGRDPDPSKAYSEAIKAVESASQALIEPNNSRATLGTMLGVIRNSPQQFTTAIPAANNGDDIAVVADMMRRLWQGQTSRHGSQNPTRLETQQQAEMAVHLAATLVQWFAAGLVRRTP
ncbi:hypothetical protein ACIBMX_10485 [Streptomyces phaeochromogenes]|uniref:hypothetical protein n=1 Tax=Streptomyces phaeochromogenes TaxID=1923 RepID=UPI0033D7BE8F